MGCWVKGCWGWPCKGFWECWVYWISRCWWLCVKGAQMQDAGCSGGAGSTGCPDTGVVGCWGVTICGVLSVLGAGDAQKQSVLGVLGVLCSDGNAVLCLQRVQVVVSQLSQVVPLLNPVPDLLQLPLEGPDEPPGFCLREPLLWVLSQEPLEGGRVGGGGDDRDMKPPASTPWCHSGVLWHPGRCGAMVAVPQAW